MQASPLDGLHDVIVPDQVAWWPLAPIWWVLIAAFVILAILLGIKLYRDSQFKKAKRFAIAQSDTLANDSVQLHILIKRLVLHYYSPEHASAATKDWCNTLNKLTEQQFSEQEIMSLYQANKSQPELAAKLKAGIKQFKLKESLDV